MAKPSSHFMERFLPIPRGVTFVLILFALVVNDIVEAGVIQVAPSQTSSPPSSALLHLTGSQNTDQAEPEPLTLTAPAHLSEESSQNPQYPFVASPPVKVNNVPRESEADDDDEGSFESGLNKLVSGGKSKEEEDVSHQTMIMNKATISKRDVEKEADSANGKTPYYLWQKKKFYHPNTRKFLSSFNNNNVMKKREPMFYSPMDIDVPVSSVRDAPPIEYRHESDGEAETGAYARLIQLLKGGSPSVGGTTGPILTNPDFWNTFGFNTPSNDAFDLQDSEEDPPLDLGYYGNDLQSSPFSSAHNSNNYNHHRPSVPQQWLDAPVYDLTKMDSDLTGNRNYDDNAYTPSVGSSPFLDEWEPAVPPSSMFRRRRRLDETLFRHNPVKSHFRRYSRSPLHEDALDPAYLSDYYSYYNTLLNDDMDNNKDNDYHYTYQSYYPQMQGQFGQSLLPHSSTNPLASSMMERKRRSLKFPAAVSSRFHSFKQYPQFVPM